MDRILAWNIVGGLSRPRKLPCLGYSIPATACMLGSILFARDPKSICAGCYARKGRYLFAVVQNALARRLASLRDPRWVEAMSTLIKPGYFRWHDSGDLQGLWHLENIVAVVKATPATQHWLPTREHKLVAIYVEKHGRFPRNLTVRLSALRFDTPGPEALARKLHVCVSEAGTKPTCPARTQGGKCGPCRTCWNPKVFRVQYNKH